MKIGRSLIVFIVQVFTDDGIFMLLDAQVEVNSYTTHCWFTSEGFLSVTFKSSEIFLLVKTGCITRSIFFPRSFSNSVNIFVSFCSG